MFSKSPKLETLEVAEMDAVVGGAVDPNAPPPEPSNEVTYRILLSSGYRYWGYGSPLAGYP